MFTEVIDQLYHGELHPSRECTPTRESLDAATRALVCEVSARAFRYGFALGAKLMREIDET